MGLIEMQSRIRRVERCDMTRGVLLPLVVIAFVVQCQNKQKRGGKGTSAPLNR